MGDTINWGIFKRRFWGELLRHQHLQIRKPDLADDWISRALARTGEDMEI